jgi:mannosyltransferase OCH1-like enzyme
MATAGRGRGAAGIALVLLVLLWPYVYCLSSVAFSYMWWLNPQLQWAPEAVPAAEQQALPVPAIIHQTWQTKQVPEKWKKAQQSCIDLHPEYEYRLWTDDDGLQLIKVGWCRRRAGARPLDPAAARPLTPSPASRPPSSMVSQDHYPWFLPTYLSYPYAIQRVDAVRYFILHLHGGIYIDLDMGCLKPLHFLRAANFTAPLTYPMGLSNDIMAAVPGDAYLGRALGQLGRWNRWLVVKYVQVMFSTGPMFLTVQYALSPRRVRDGVAAISRPVYGKYDFSGEPALYHLHGSSWHADDAAFVFWLDRNRGMLGVLALVAAAAAAAAWSARRQWGGPGRPVSPRPDVPDVEKQI